MFNWHRNSPVSATSGRRNHHFPYICSEHPHLTSQHQPGSPHGLIRAQAASRYAKRAPNTCDAYVTICALGLGEEKRACTFHIRAAIEPNSAVHPSNLHFCSTAFVALTPSHRVVHDGHVRRLGGEMAILSPSPAHAKLSLLLVDDDAELCSMMQEFFAENGHQITCAYNGRDGLARALEEQYDLVILDVMLPLINGFTVLHQIRRHTAVPIIMLTARTHRSDRIEGLDKGADDYLAKPFDPDELLARIRAVLRRLATSQHLDDAVTKFGEIRIDLSRREVWRGNRLIDLTAMEFDILDLLARSAGRIVSRKEITEALFEREASPYDRSLDVHVSRLRKKLEYGHTLIRTIRGVGYVFTSAEH